MKREKKSYCTVVKYIDLYKLQHNNKSTIN